MNKPKRTLIDAYLTGLTLAEAAALGRRLVKEHLVGVSYVIPARTFYQRDDVVVEEEDSTVLIMKSTNILFQSRLVLSTRSTPGSWTELVALLPVDVADDYRNWILQEVVDSVL